MKVAKLEIIDQVNCRFHNLDPGTKRNLRQKFRYFQPWAVHSPQFKAKWWDGYEYMMDQGGRTFIGLLEPALEYLIANGWQIELDDKRPDNSFKFPTIKNDVFSDTVWPKKHKFEGQPIVLLDHQVNAINTFFDNPSCLQELPTSAGKTLITAALSKFCEPYGRTIVIVPNKSLILQTEEDYRNVGLDVGVYFGDRKELGHTHTICTWQILNILEKKSKRHSSEDALLLAELLNDVNAVIVDEVHQAKAKALKSLLSGPLAHVPIRWGLTGTIPKEEYDKAVISCMVGPTVDIITPKELQEKGYLAACSIDVLQLEDQLQFGDYHTEMDYLVHDKDRLTWISNFVKETSKEGNTLVLCSQIETGKIMSDVLGCPFISGSMKVKARREHYDDIHDANDSIIIATYGVAAVGINIPRIFNLVLLEPGKSFVRVIQSIGRGLRVAKDKNYVQIYDISSTCKYSKKHLAERVKYYKEKEYVYNKQKVKWK